MICVSEQTIKTSFIHTLIQVQGTDPRITVGLTLHVSRWCEAVAATSCALLWADRCFRCRSLLGTARGSSHSQPDTPGTSAHFLLFLLQLSDIYVRCSHARTETTQERLLTPPTLNPSHLNQPKWEWEEFLPQPGMANSVGQHLKL